MATPPPSRSRILVTGDAQRSTHTLSTNSSTSGNPLTGAAGFLGRHVVAQVTLAARCYFRKHSKRVRL
jgi:hypothetical protein